MHLSLTQILRRPRALLATALLAGLLAPVGAHAASAVTGSGVAQPKAPAPTLAIDTRLCATGPNVEDRFATITASALLGNVGYRVAIRFTLQQLIIPPVLGKAKPRWQTVPAGVQAGLGRWHRGKAGKAGLRYKTTIAGLGEGAQFRVRVEAQALDFAGRAATRKATRYAGCDQPLYTPTVQLLTVVDAVYPVNNQPTKNAVLRNAGSLVSKPVVVTVQDAATHALLGTVTTATGFTGDTTVSVPLTSCTDRVFVTVQEQGVAFVDLRSDQALTVPCFAAAGAKAQRERASR
jgi:hypothetical protein